MEPRTCKEVSKTKGMGTLVPVPRTQQESLTLVDLSSCPMPVMIDLQFFHMEHLYKTTPLLC